MHTGREGGGMYKKEKGPPEIFFQNCLQKNSIKGSLLDVFTTHGHPTHNIWRKNNPYPATGFSTRVHLGYKVLSEKQFFRDKVGTWINCPTK